MKFFDLFSGIGGFHKGLEDAGHTCVGACEWNVNARSIYERHWPDTKIWDDAAKLDPSELPEFELLCAGFPCQAFSMAGKRLGFKEPRGSVFYEIIRLAREKRPRLLLLENVRGLFSHDNGWSFAKVLAALDECGYDAQWQMLNSACWVPQNRNRIYIIGHLRDTPRPEIFPISETDNDDEQNGAKANEQGKRLPTTTTPTILAGYGDMSTTDPIIKLPRLRQVIPGRDAERVYDADGLARTLKANGGGMGAKTGLYQMDVKDAGSIRRLTPLECEKLQGFPADWTKYDKDGKLVTDTNRYKCIGNAVTVPVISWIGAQL